MNEDEWVEAFIPLPNPFAEGTGFDFGGGGCLLNEDDLRNIVNIGNEAIWSVIECSETYDMYICLGVHKINVLGYIVTEKSPDSTDFEGVLCD